MHVIHQQKGSRSISNNKYVSGILSWIGITMDCGPDMIYYQEHGFWRQNRIRKCKRFAEDTKSILKDLIILESYSFNMLIRQSQYIIDNIIPLWRQLSCTKTYFAYQCKQKIMGSNHSVLTFLNDFFPMVAPMSFLIKYVVKQKYVFVDILTSQNIIVLFHCVSILLRGVQRGYVIAHTSEHVTENCAVKISVL